MPIEGTLTEKDYVKAQYLHMRPRGVYAIPGVLILILMVWASIETGSSFLFFILVFLCAYFFLIIPLSAKRIFRRYKALSEKVSVEIKENGLYFHRVNGEGLVPWDEIYKWKSSDKLILLYPTSNIFYMLPRHFFHMDKEYMDFVGLLNEKISGSG